MTDVTARYASDWLTVARRNRVDESWWEETLRPFRTPNMFEITEENEDISGTGSSKVWLLKYYSYDGYATSLPMQAAHCSFRLFEGSRILLHMCRNMLPC